MREYVRGWLIRMRLGSTARITVMIFSGLVTLMIAGAAVEQRRFEASTLAHQLPPHRGAWALVILRAAGALGVLAMVLIQSFKQPLRGRFHSLALRQWVGLSSSSHSSSLYSERRNAFFEILHLIAPSYSQDILALPIEQLSAQLASAADFALIGHRESLLLSLAGEEAHMYVMQYLKLLSTQSKWQSPAGAGVSGAGVAPQSLESEKMPELLEVRNTLSHIIQRRIDGFQIHFGNEWKSILRVMAITLSASLAAVGILVSGEFATQPCTAAAFALIVGLMGGLLASVARDVVAIIEKYRK